MEHPTIEELHDFAAGRLERERTRFIVAHFLQGCRRCREEAALLNLLQLGRKRDFTIPHAGYDRALDRAQEFALALVAAQSETRAEAPGVSLESGSWVEDLLARSWNARYENAGEMLRLARQAVKAAESLPRQGKQARQAADLQCRAWAHLGNALRVLGRFPEAEAALERAARLLDEGSGSSELKAWVYDFQASLYGAQRRFKACWAALDMVHALHREHGRPHLAGRALISKAVYKSCAGRCQEALRLTSEGLALIDPEAEPALFLLAVQNQLCQLVECGLVLQARELLERHRPEWGKDGLNELQLRWLEGRIAAGLGEPLGAAEHLSAARRGFEAASLHYRAALVALDLGPLLLRLGRATEARQVLVGAVDTFLKLKVTREAVASAEVLRKALEMEATPLVLVSQLTDFLRSLTRDPA